MGRLTGKSVLITGASSGIGQAIAIRFAAEGANVAINYRSDEEQANATLDMARAARTEGGGREIVIQADVSNEDQVKQMVASTIGEFGRLDVLVNNAGIQKPCPSHELEAADFDRVLAVNLRGPFLCAREALKHFLSRPGKFLSQSPQRVLDVSQQLRRFSQKKISGQCRSDCPRGPFQQVHSKTLLHPLHLPRNGTLGKPRQPGCPRETSMFRDQVEQMQFVQVERRRAQIFMHKTH